MNIAIVVVGFNRVDSIERLLKSLLLANYNEYNVPLIISIDKSETSEVLKLAKGYIWPFGEKKVVEHKENLGLKKHILYCGNLTKEYEAVIVLEDDLYVSPNFYTFARQAITKYEENINIAGISLYSHQWNVNADRPFEPRYNNYDAYFLKFAQSWGQVWNRRMWEEFYSWYTNNTTFHKDIKLPSNVNTWSSSSWLKFYIKFIVEMDKYFIYPYQSLTTNFTETGVHHTRPSTVFQVQIELEEKKKYSLPEFDKDSLKYDVFFEREDLEHSIAVPNSELCIDLYGSKKNSEEKRYWLTSEISDYEILGSYALQFRPHEINIELQIPGSEIFLYDTSNKNIKNFNSKKTNFANRIKYDIKGSSRIETFKSLLIDLNEQINLKLKKRKY